MLKVTLIGLKRLVILLDGERVVFELNIPQYFEDFEKKDFLKYKDKYGERVFKVEEVDPKELKDSEIIIEEEKEEEEEEKESIKEIPKPIKVKKRGRPKKNTPKFAGTTPKSIKLETTSVPASDESE